MSLRNILPKFRDKGRPKLPNNIHVLIRKLNNVLFIVNVNEEETLFKFLEILEETKRYFESQTSSDEHYRKCKMVDSALKKCSSEITKYLFDNSIREMPLSIFVWVTEQKVKCILDFITNLMHEWNASPSHTYTNTDHIPIKEYIHAQWSIEEMENAMRDVPNDCKDVKNLWEYSISLREAQLNPHKYSDKGEARLFLKSKVDGLYNKLFADMRGKPSMHVLYEKVFGFSRFSCCYLCGIGQVEPSMTTNVSGPSCSRCKKNFCKDCLKRSANAAVEGFSFNYGNPSHSFTQKIDWSCSACREPGAFLTYLIDAIGKKQRLSLPTIIPISVQRYQEFRINFVYELIKQKQPHAKLEDAVQMLFNFKWDMDDIMEHFGFFR